MVSTPESPSALKLRRVEEKNSLVFSHASTAPIAVKASSEITALMIPRKSFFTRKYNSMASGVILMAAARPIRTPRGILRLIGSRSMTTKAMIKMLIWPKSAFKNTGSAKRAIGQEIAAMVKANSLSRPLRTALVTRYRHSNNSRDEPMTTRFPASSTVMKSKYPQGANRMAPIGG